MPRYLALDVGDSTIGIAVSDPMGVTAQGVETIRRQNLADDLARLARLMETYDTQLLVIGMPRNMNGTEGEQCQGVRAFAEEINKKFPAAEIKFWDERLTTVLATNVLKEAGLNWRKRRKVVDKMAAVIILQGFLDSLN